MSIAKSQGDQLLQTSVDLVVHRRVLRGDLIQLLEQPRAAVVVASLSVLEPLAVVRGRLLRRLERVGL